MRCWCRLRCAQACVPCTGAATRSCGPPPPAGMTFALAASPCSTPILATLLAYVSTTRDPVTGEAGARAGLLRAPLLRKGRVAGKARAQASFTPRCPPTCPPACCRRRAAVCLHAGLRGAAAGSRAVHRSPAAHPVGAPVERVDHAGQRRAAAGRGDLRPAHASGPSLIAGPAAGQCVRWSSTITRVWLYGGIPGCWFLALGSWLRCNQM